MSLREWDDISHDEWVGMTERQKVNWMRRAAMNATFIEAYRACGEGMEPFRVLARRYGIRFADRVPQKWVSDGRTREEMSERESIARQARAMGPPSMQTAEGEVTRHGDQAIWRRRFSEDFRERFCAEAKKKPQIRCAQELAALLRESALGYPEVINVPPEPLVRYDPIPRSSSAAWPSIAVSQRGTP